MNISEKNFCSQICSPQVICVSSVTFLTAAIGLTFFGFLISAHFFPHSPVAGFGHLKIGIVGVVVSSCIPMAVAITFLGIRCMKATIGRTKHLDDLEEEFDNIDIDEEFERMKASYENVRDKMRIRLEILSAYNEIEVLENEKVLLGADYMRLYLAAMNDAELGPTNRVITLDQQGAFISEQFLAREELLARRNRSIQEQEERVQEEIRIKEESIKQLRAKIAKLAKIRYGRNTKLLV